MGKVMQGIQDKKGEFVGEQEVDDVNCLYKRDVIKLIGKKNWTKFSKWMRGQGVPVMSDGTEGYFSWDVEEFKTHYIDGVPRLTLKEVGEIVKHGTLNGKKIPRSESIHKVEVSPQIGKINTREWNSTRKGAEFKENQHKKSKDPSYHAGLKRTKLRWNKKKGVREKSKKGSRDRIFWYD